MKQRTLGYLGSAALWMGACAGTPVPHEQLASTEAALRASHELGAEHVPQAELHQRLAEEQLDKARKLIQDGENERSKLMLQRARADAELSVALAREETARSQAQNVVERVAVPRASADTEPRSTP